MIPESHVITLRPPRELPAGAAEIIVLSDPSATSVPTDTVAVETCLAKLNANVPDAPVIPLEALR